MKLRNTFKKMKKIITLFFLLILLTGCGYTNPYSETTALDEDQDGTVSIFVDMWTNQTAELGFQSYIKQSLVGWLKKSPRFTMARDKASSDFTLDGTIFSARYPGLSYGSFDRAIELRAEIELSFNLKNSKTGKTVLQSRKITRRESFRVGTVSAEAETNKQLALMEIADDIADNIFVQVFYKFSRDDIKGVRDEIMPEDDIDEIDD